jgi:hypothetical protein
LDQALETALRSVPDCVVAGYVDLRTGVLLGVKTAESHPQEALDLVSATAAGLFQDPNLSAVESWVLNSDGGDSADSTSIQEFVVMSDQLLHMFTRCKSNHDHVAVFVMRKSANIGMALTRSRKAATALDDAV